MGTNIADNRQQTSSAAVLLGRLACQQSSNVKFVILRHAYRNNTSTSSSGHLTKLTHVGRVSYLGERAFYANLNLTVPTPPPYKYQPAFLTTILCLFIGALYCTRGRRRTGGTVYHACLCCFDFFYKECTAPPIPGTCAKQK